MTEQQVFELCDQIRETAFALHRYLKHGHLEKVYENGLLHRLMKQGVKVEQSSLNSRSWTKTERRWETTMRTCPSKAY
jgi:GxxExxY protein